MMLDQYFRYNTHGLLGIAAGAIDISVGLVVLSRNFKALTNRTFFFATYAPFIWITAFGFESLVRTKEAAFFWQSVAYGNGVPFIPLAFYLFSLAWTKQSLGRPTVWAAFFWSVTASIPMTFFTQNVVGMEEYGWGRFPYFLSTPLARVYAAYVLVPFFLLTVISARSFYRGWRDANSPQERRQFLTLLAGFVIAHVGAGDFITGFRYDFYPSGYISLSIFIGLVAYTIVRHQFLEINLLFHKVAAVFLIYVLLFAIVTPLGFIFLGTTLSGLSHDQLIHVVIFWLIASFVISMGPFAYAYLTRNAFWLRSRSSTGLTHELKSPLSAIESSVGVLLQAQSKDSIPGPIFKSYLEIIDRNTQRLRLFIDDLLKLAQIQDSDIGLKKELMPLATIITDVIEQYRAVTQSKGLIVTFDRGGDFTLELDREKIRQVISNLLSNAVKFSERGELKIKLDKVRHDCLVSISDKGRGVQSHEIAHLFERFYQGQNALHGSGIGLTIAKAWVEAHGGKIWAESEGEGKGTTVTFTLPI